MNLTLIVSFCSSVASFSAVHTIQQHLASSISVPTFPITSGSPKQSRKSSCICSRRRHSSSSRKTKQAQSASSHIVPVAEQQHGPNQARWSSCPAAKSASRQKDDWLQPRTTCNHFWVHQNIHSSTLVTAINQHSSHSR